MFRRCLPWIRNALVVAAVCGSGFSAAQETIVYVGRGQVSFVEDVDGSLPVAAKAGDDFRFRAVIDTATAGVPAVGSGTVYEGAIRELSVWVQGVPAQLPPTMFRLGTDTNVLFVRNDGMIDDCDFCPRDSLSLRWRQPLGVGDREVEFSVSVGDYQSLKLVDSEAIPLAINYTSLASGGGGLTVFDRDGNRRDTLGVQLTGVAVTREVTDPGVFGVPARTPSDAWVAAATVSQNPRHFASPDGKHVTVALWFNDFNDVASLHFGSDATAITQVLIRCGVAGEEGNNVVWALSEPDTNLADLADTTLTILAKDLIHSGSTPGCTDAARNLAAFKAAAEARLLYIEIEKSHNRIVHRGQLWPRSIGLQDGGFASLAGASDQQNIDAKDAAPQWQRLAVTLSFSETNQTLDYVGYSVPRPASFPRREPVLRAARPRRSSGSSSARRRRYAVECRDHPDLCEWRLRDGNQQHCVTARSIVARQPVCAPRAARRFGFQASGQFPVR